MLYVSPMAIRNTARQLVDELGDDAPDLAVRKAAQMEKVGNKTGRTDWLCVMISAQRMLLDRHGW